MVFRVQELCILFMYIAQTHRGVQEHTYSPDIHMICGFGQQTSWKMWSGEKETEGCRVKAMGRLHYSKLFPVDKLQGLILAVRGSVDTVQRKLYLPFKNSLHKRWNDCIILHRILLMGEQPVCFQ